MPKEESSRHPPENENNRSEKDNTALKERIQTLEPTHTARARARAQARTSTGSMTSTSIPPTLLLPTTSRSTSGVPITVRYDLSVSLHKHTHDERVGGAQSPQQRSSASINIKLGCTDWVRARMRRSKSAMGVHDSPEREKRYGTSPRARSSATAVFAVTTRPWNIRMMLTRHLLFFWKFTRTAV